MEEDNRARLSRECNLSPETSGCMPEGFEGLVSEDSFPNDCGDRSEEVEMATVDGQKRIVRAVCITLRW